MSGVGPPLEPQNSWARTPQQHEIRIGPMPDGISGPLYTCPGLTVTELITFFLAQQSARARSLQPSVIGTTILDELCPSIPWPPTVAGTTQWGLIFLLGVGGGVDWCLAWACVPLFCIETLLVAIWGPDRCHHGWIRPHHCA